MSVGSAEELAQRCGLAAGAELDPHGQPLLDVAEDERLTGTFSDVDLVLGDADQGPGTLYASNRRIFWVSSAAATERPTYSVGFTAITMHAMAGASESFARPSIYMQLDGALVPDDDPDSSAPEVRLAPANASTVEAIFQALCEGAAANPDPDAEEDEGDFYFDEDEVANGANGHAEMLDKFDGMLQLPPDAQAEEGQFDDPDEDANMQPDAPAS